jgi:hypothetical protein
MPSQIMSSEPLVFTRREMLRMATGSLLAMGLWPASALSATEAREFVFLVANDLHFRDSRCAPWFEAVANAMKRHGADFCVLNGDISENGTADQLATVRDIFETLGVPVFATIGNHDYASEDRRGAFEEIFPRQLNYHFEHKGWRFVALDSTQGQRVFCTRVPETTLQWLDETLPHLDQSQPTVLLTHFPLGPRVLCRPLNAPAVLARFRHHNLRAVFNGHWHGFSQREIGHTTIATNRCCSWWRKNNDGSPDKGYLLCRATSEGSITRSFCLPKAFS